MKVKVRNLIQVHCWNRKAGVHGKTKKAQRRDDKVLLKKNMDM